METKTSVDIAKEAFEFAYNQYESYQKKNEEFGYEPLSFAEWVQDIFSVPQYEPKSLSYFKDLVSQKVGYDNWVHFIEHSVSGTQVDKLLCDAERMYYSQPNRIMAYRELSDTDIYDTVKERYKGHSRPITDDAFKSGLFVYREKSREINTHLVDAYELAKFIQDNDLYETEELTWIDARENGVFANDFNELMQIFEKQQSNKTTSNE